VIGFLGAAIVTEPWITYLVVSFAYILTLPVSGVKFIRERRLFEAGKL